MAGRYPSLCYQRPGFSDIEKKVTTTLVTISISYLYPQSHPHYPRRYHRLFYGNLIPLHAVPPIITALQAQGQSCTLVINDRVLNRFLMRCWKH